MSSNKFLLPKLLRLAAEKDGLISNNIQSLGKKLGFSVTGSIVRLVQCLGAFDNSFPLSYSIEYRNLTKSLYLLLVAEIIEDENNRYKEELLDKITNRTRHLEDEYFDMSSLKKE